MKDEAVIGCSSLVIGHWLLDMREKVSSALNLRMNRFISSVAAWCPVSFAVSSNPWQCLRGYSENAHSAAGGPYEPHRR